MKGKLNYFLFGILMLFGFSLNVNAETLPEAVNGKITLDKDYTIGSTTFDSTSAVSVLDLNGKTLTLNGILKLNKEFEIKNGTVIRNTSNTYGSLIEVNAGDKVVNLKDLVIDGNKIVMTLNVANGAGFGIFVKTDANAVLDNVTVRNNYTGTNIAAGGLYIQSNTSVVVKNSEFYGNRATWTSGGSAIYAQQGKKLEIINTKIHDNYSATCGVVNINGVENFLLDKDSIIYNNESTVATGLRLWNTNGIVAGTIRDNVATEDNGGGIYTIFTDNQYKDRVITITETAKILNNESAFAGGGLYVNSDKTNIPGKVVINGATFSGNKALGTVDASAGLYKDIGGGAITVARGILEINDVKISGNTAAINKGNAIMVSHANGNSNGGKLTINGGAFDDSIDLGVGSIVVNGGTFKYDMASYITNNKLISKKTSKGYEVVENTTLKNENVTFDNDAAMDNNYTLVVTNKSDLLEDEELVEDINDVITSENEKAIDVEVLALYDISVSDGTNAVEMKDGNYRITIDLDEDLLIYDYYAGVYVDDDGNVTYLPVEVKDGKAVIITGHLSTYGIVGYNEEVEVPSEGGEEEAVPEVKNPETVRNIEIIVTIILFGLMIAGIGISMKKQNA